MEDKAFLLLLAGVSAAFLLIVWPFYGAVFWAIVLAVLFMPLYRRTLRWMRHRPTIAALVTVLLVVLIVILPLTAIGALLAQEAASTYARIQAGELNFGRYFEQMLEALPTWMVNLLHASRLIDPAAMRERLSGSSCSFCAIFSACCCTKSLFMKNSRCSGTLVVNRCSAEIVAAGKSNSCR